MMNISLKRMGSKRRALSGLLVLAFLSLTLFPYHYHLQHSDGSAHDATSTPAHALDTHFHTSAYIHDHHHDEVQTIESSTDITLKSSGPLLALFFIVSLLLFTWQETYQRQRLPDHKPSSTTPHSRPPLRAPPRR